MPAALLAQPERALCSCLPGWTAALCPKATVTRHCSAAVLWAPGRHRSEGINGSKARASPGAHSCMFQVPGSPRAASQVFREKSCPLSIWKSRRRNRAGTVPTGSELGRTCWPFPVEPSIHSLYRASGTGLVLIYSIYSEGLDSL